MWDLSAQTDFMDISKSLWLLTMEIQSKIFGILLEEIMPNYMGTIPAQNIMFPKDNSWRIFNREDGKGKYLTNAVN